MSSFIVEADFDLSSFQLVNNLQIHITHEQEGISSVRMSCFAHTLQLTIRDGLQKNPHIAKILGKCETLARFAHKSSKIADLLDQINKHIERPNLTRWNSDFMLIKSILSIKKEDMESILDLMDDSIQFSNNDFIMMEEMVDILEPFYQISLKCQADKVVTISLVVPSIVHLVCHLRSIKVNLSFCNQLVQQLQSSIERRFAGVINRLYQTDVKDDDPFNDPLYFMTTLLDPAFKLFWIDDLKLPVNIESRLKQSVIQFVVDETSEDVKPTPTNSLKEGNLPLNQSSSVAHSPTSKPKRMKLFVYNNVPYDHTKSDGSKTCNPSLELEAYLNDPVRLNFSDYWLRSPLVSLKKLVVRIFSVQASSAPIERVFSHAGLILSSRRTRMNEQLFRDIVFLKANRYLL